MVTDHERAVPVSALQHQERWWGCLCLCVHRNMKVIIPPHPTRFYHLPHPHPPQPNPNGTWTDDEDYLCSECAWKSMVIIPPLFPASMTPPIHPTPPQPKPEMAGSQHQCARMTALFVRGWRGFSVRGWLVCNVRRWLAFNVRRWRVDRLEVPGRRHVDSWQIRHAV